MKRRKCSKVAKYLVYNRLSVFLDFVSFYCETAKKILRRFCEGSMGCKIPRAGLDELKRETPDLDRIVDKVLLLCSMVELTTRDP